MGVRPGVAVAPPASPCGAATPAATASSQLGGEDEAACGVAHRSTSHSFWVCSSAVQVWELDPVKRTIKPTECQSGMLKRVVKCMEVRRGEGTGSHSWAAIGGCVHAAFLPCADIRRRPVPVLWNHQWGRPEVQPEDSAAERLRSKTRLSQAQPGGSCPSSAL